MIRNQWYVVDGPVIGWKGDRLLYTYVFNRLDDGTPLRRSRDLSAKDAASVRLEFIFSTCGKTTSARMYAC